MKKYLIAGLAATMIAPAAHALVIDQSETLTFSTQTETLPNTFNFNGYTGTDPLARVDLSVGGSVFGTVSITNSGTSTVFSDAEAGSRFIFSSDDITITTAAPQFEARGSTGLLTIPAGDTVIGNVSSSGGFSEQFTTGLSSFTGSYSIRLDTLPFLTLFSNSNNLTATQNTTTTAEITANYLIEEPVAPIPLPAAAWMMLAALGSLFAVRRYSKA